MVVRPRSFYKLLHKIHFYAIKFLLNYQKPVYDNFIKVSSPFNSSIHSDGTDYVNILRKICRVLLVKSS